MGWPGMVEYSAAVQARQASFLPPELKTAEVVLNRLGLPKVCSGAFAIVYELREGGNSWAIRCFTKEVGDLRERYAAIAEHLKAAKVPHFVPFDYIPEGIRVNGKTYPIVKMQWVHGVPLNRYVEDNLGRPDRLLALAAKFGELVDALERKRIGHGDISADNVLITGDAITLIDYDGMYVPRLSGRKARELGNPAFQHPKRDETVFGPEIDRFSVLVIGTALAALAADPTLWKRFGGGNGVLFSAVDLRDPDGSGLFRALRAAGSPALRALADQLAAWCRSNPAKLGKLPDLKRLKIRPAAVEVPAAVPSAPAAAAPVPAAAAGAGQTVAMPAVAAAAGWWRQHAAPGRQPADPGTPPAAPATPSARAPLDWTGVFAAAVGLGVFAILFAPRTGSWSVLALPAILAIVAWGEIASQRLARSEGAGPGGATGRAPLDWTSVFVTAVAVGLFAVLFAPRTESLSLLALPVVVGMVVASKKAAASAGSGSAQAGGQVPPAVPPPGQPPP